MLSSGFGGFSWGRFMERNDARGFLRRDPEPLSEEDRERPSSRPSPGGRRRTLSSGFGGLSWGRFMERNDERSFLRWDPEPLSEEDRERPSSRPSHGGRRRTLSSGFGGLSRGRFMESPLVKIDLPMGHERERPQGGKAWQPERTEVHGVSQGCWKRVPMLPCVADTGGSAA